MFGKWTRRQWLAGLFGAVATSIAPRARGRARSASVGPSPRVEEPSASDTSFTYLADGSMCQRPHVHERSDTFSFCATRGQARP